jgi:hypothetical protein
MNEYRTPLFMHLTRLIALQHLDLSSNCSLKNGMPSLQRMTSAARALCTRAMHSVCNAGTHMQAMHGVCNAGTHMQAACGMCNRNGRDVQHVDASIPACSMCFGIQCGMCTGIRASAAACALSSSAACVLASVPVLLHCHTAVRSEAVACTPHCGA